MLRNQLHPISLFSTSILSFGVLFLACAGKIYSDELARFKFMDHDLTRFSLHNWPTDILIIFFVFLGIGAFLCIGAVGITFRKSWARNLVQAGLIFLALSWLGHLLNSPNNTVKHPILSAGITFAILGSVIGALLFLNNINWVLSHFQKALQGEGQQEILDQDAWEQKN
ncbi:MAG: hypothetical protein AAFZ63_20790 [Bacteroidota bacterium]